MANPRIETSAANIQLPATGNNISPQEMEGDIVRYWGNIDQEKKFLLPFWKGNILMAQSPSNEIALKVTHIEDPAQVDAEWVSYDPNNPDGQTAPSGGLIGWLINLLETLAGPTEDPPTAYFVLGEAFFPLNSDTELKRFTPHHKMALVARIGRTTAGITVVFFLAGEIQLKVGPGAGGPGLSSGAKIPGGTGDN